MIAETATKVSYLGDGITKAFPFSFKYDDVEHVKALIHDVNTGVETAITSDYYIDTTAGVFYYPGYAPGQEAPEADQPAILDNTKKLVIYRETPATQLIDLGEKYPLPVLEKMADKLCLIEQEHAELLARAIKVTIGDTTSPDELMEELNNSVAAAMAASAEATTKATEAGTSATNAAASATAASTEAEAAGTSATAAAGSVTEAAGKVTECAAQVTAAQAVVDNAKDEITEKALAEARAYGLPIGTIIPFSGNGDYPNGCLLCDGASLSRAMYPKLFDVIGVTYGSVDDEHFNLPNLTDKFIEGSSTAGTEYSAGLPNITGSFLGYDLDGDSSGVWSGAFTCAESSATSSGGTTNNGERGTSFSAAYGEVHNGVYSNLVYGKSDTVQPPALTMRYIIKAFDGETAESALIDVTQYANELAGKLPLAGGTMAGPIIFSRGSIKEDANNKCLTFFGGTDGAGGARAELWGTELDGHFSLVAKDASGNDYTLYGGSDALKWRGKEIKDMAFPSATHIDCGITSSPASYTAPANGYISISASATTANDYVMLTNNFVKVTAQNNVTGDENAAFIPCKKGGEIGIAYTGTLNFCLFIYAEGEI